MYCSILKPYQEKVQSSVDLDVIAELERLEHEFQDMERGSDNEDEDDDDHDGDIMDDSDDGKNEIIFSLVYWTTVVYQSWIFTSFSSTRKWKKEWSPALFQKGESHHGDIS